MKTETRMFFDAILRENRPIGEFIDGRYTFLNELLAKLLRDRGRDRAGIPARRRSRTDERGGVLSHGSVLAVSSYPDAHVGRDSRQVHPAEHSRHAAAAAAGRRAAARRGGRRHDDVAAQADGERIAPTPICASCHSRMDPLGFALENYDAIGKWRTMDGDFPVDSSGVLPDGKRSRRRRRCARSSASMLDEFSRTLTEKMLVYALGRGLERYDRPTVVEITTRPRSRPATASRRWCARSSTACRSSRAAPRRRAPSSPRGKSSRSMSGTHAAGIDRPPGRGDRQT